MKHNILTSISGACLLSALVLAGCTKALPAPSGYPEDGVVRISTGAPVTKAEGDAGAYNGSTLGLYVNYGVGDNYTKDNIQWTKDADSGEWTPAKQMLWKNPTATPTLWAYAPYSASQLHPLSSAFGQLLFNIPADQSAGIEAADFVTWGQENYVLNHNTNQNFSEDGKVQINFSHALVKLTFDFTIRTQFEPGTTISKVTLNGTSSTVGCDIFNSSVAATSDATSDITLHKVDDTHYDCIFFPGEGQKAGQKMLTVEMSDGTVLYYNTNKDLSFESGKAYTMKMYLGRLAIELNQVTLDPWTNSNITIDGGTGSETSIPVWDGSSSDTSFLFNGNGLSNDPYIITNGAQLHGILERDGWRNQYFKLANSIDLGGHEWTPIGNSTTPFKGHFDGNGYTIYGLSIQNDVNGYAGLFGKVEGSKISGLSVNNANIRNQSSNTGIICGELAGGGVISNCSVYGGSVSTSSSSSQSSSAGGICGLYSSESTINNCNVRGISIKGGYVGGICGQGAGKIENCKVYDTQMTADWSGGGIVSVAKDLYYSDIESTIKNCVIYNSELYCTSEATYAGGLIAFTDNLQVNASDCSANLDIHLAKSQGHNLYAGGLIGYVIQYQRSANLKNCHFNGKFINDEGEMINYDGTSYTNISYDAESVIRIGAVIGEETSGYTRIKFDSCSYNADKTGGLPVVGEGPEGQNHPGITAVHHGN